MHTISSKLMELEKVIYDKVEHPYIDKFLEKPFIDFDKLAMLYYLYDDSSITESKKTSYITTIMLVQLALDTHELIPSPSETSMDETEKQLTVLAGDFYSGLYYYLLAEIEDIALIRTLAGAIEKINEYKMLLYKKDVSSLEQYVEVMKQIEITLFEEVAQTLQVNEDTIELVGQFFMINRLNREKEKIGSSHFSYIESYLEEKALIIGEKNIKRWIEDEILIGKEKIAQSLTMRRQGCMMLESYLMSRLSINNSMMLAEEG